MKRSVACALFFVACGGATPRPDPHAQLACPAPPPPPPCECDAGAADRDALERLARAEEERARLEEQLAQRVQQAQQQVDGGVVAMTQARADAYAQVHAAIDSMTRDAAACDRAIDLAVHVRAALEPAPPLQPAICRDARLRGEVDAAVLGGQPAMTSFSSVRERIADLCDRFTERAQPDDRAQRLIQIYGEQVDRVERYTAEVSGCAGATGHRAYECDNTYGTIDATTVGEAQRAHEMVEALRRELAAPRAFHAPFPCTTPTLARIDAIDHWQGAMTSAQMPGLVQGARHVCEALGWDDDAIRESSRVLSRTVDGAEANARARKRAYEQSIESMRAQLPE